MYFIEVSSRNDDVIQNCDRKLTQLTLFGQVDAIKNGIVTCSRSNCDCDEWQWLVLCRVFWLSPRKLCHSSSSFQTGGTHLQKPSSVSSLAGKQHLKCCACLATLFFFLKLEPLFHSHFVVTVICRLLLPLPGWIPIFVDLSWLLLQFVLG